MFVALKINKKLTGAVSIAADPLTCLDSAMFAHDQQSCGRTKRWRLGDRRGNSMSAGEDFSVVSASICL